jgi:hypothetical protein
MVWVLSTSIACVFVIPGGVLIWLIVQVVCAFNPWLQKPDVWLLVRVSQAALSFSEVDQMGHRLSVIGLLFCVL